MVNFLSEALTNGYTFIINLASAIIGTLVWILPNYIYFSERKYIFFKNNESSSSKIVDKKSEYDKSEDDNINSLINLLENKEQQK